MDELFRDEFEMKFFQGILVEINKTNGSAARFDMHTQVIFHGGANFILGGVRSQSNAYNLFSFFVLNSNRIYFLGNYNQVFFFIFKDNDLENYISKSLLTTELYCSCSNAVSNLNERTNCRFAPKCRKHRPWVQYLTMSKCKTHTNE